MKYLTLPILLLTVIACDGLASSVCTESMERIDKDKAKYECGTGATISREGDMVYCRCPKKPVSADAGILTLDAGTPQ
jgi:hypothetical protein